MTLTGILLFIGSYVLGMLIYVIVELRRIAIGLRRVEKVIKGEIK
jgi:uncharacterized integral membrane protein